MCIYVVAGAVVIGIVLLLWQLIASVRLKPEPQLEIDPAELRYKRLKQLISDKQYQIVIEEYAENVQDEELGYLTTAYRQTKNWIQVGICVERLYQLHRVSRVDAIADFIQLEQPEKILAVCKKEDLLHLKTHKSWDEFYNSLFSVVWAYQQLQQAELAIAVLQLAPQRSINPNANVLKAYWLLGLLHEKIGEPKQALKYYQKIESHSPNYNGLHEALNRLQKNDVSHIDTVEISEIILMDTISFVAIDFETANNARSSVCSIGMVKVVNGKIADRYHKYLRPKPFRSNKFNIELHGITPEMTRNAPTLGNDWANIQAFVGDLPLVAHNASFDLSVLNESLQSCEMESSGWRIECTLMMARKQLSLHHNKLSDLCDHFNIPLRHHDAGSDAEACAKLYLKLRGR
jgi:DNA polymerase-3 subunit epsilon